MGFGGTMVLTGASWMEDCFLCGGLWRWAEGIFNGLWPRGSMRCMSVLDSGLSGGFAAVRAGAESTSVLLDACESCRDSETPAQLDTACEGPSLTLLYSLLVIGSLTWSVHADCWALDVVWLTTRTVGMLVTESRGETGGLGCRARFAGGLAPLRLLIITSPGVWKKKIWHEQTAFQKLRQTLLLALMGPLQMNSTLFFLFKYHMPENCSDSSFSWTESSLNWVDCRNHFYIHREI